MKKNKKRVKRKRILAAMLACFFAFLGLSFATRFAVSESNYAHNLNAEPAFMQNLKDSFINNQNSTSDFKFGIKNSDFNGCGWISVYNANKILGISQSIPDIIKDLDVWGVNLFGLLGTNPFVIKSYYSKKGYQTKFITKSEKFEENIKASKVSIIGYFSFEGGHYQTVESISETQQRFYNPQQTISVDSYLSAHKNTAKFLITIK